MFCVLYSFTGPAPDALLAIAADFTPRYEVCDASEILLDISGLDRLFGDSRAVGDALRGASLERHVRIRIAIARTCTAARLLARAGGDDIVVVGAGMERAAVAPLPLEVLAHLGDGEILNTVHRWGLRTLGDLAALPADDVAARLGNDGVVTQRFARGEDMRPLRPEIPKERFEQALDLEWPIDGLEPLSFVLGRLLEPLTAHLARRGRGAAVLHVRLHLVTRVVYERSLQLPAPMCDARTFRTLLLLDLESHPPPAAIERVVVAVDPTPARVVQFSLLARPLPSPEQLSTLMARLAALMGEDRCGSPVAVNTWRPGAFEMQPFNPGIGDWGSGIGGNRPTRANAPSPGGDAASPIPDPRSPRVALRRFRVPIPARVRVDHDVPTHVRMDRRGLSGGRVDTCAGPWRSSGGWWTAQLPTPNAATPNGPQRHGQRPTPNAATAKVEHSAHALGIGNLGVGSCMPWDRDEWDVALSDGAAYRVFRDRATGAWFVEGIVD